MKYYKKCLVEFQKIFQKFEKFQIAERIDDMRLLSISRRDALQKLASHGVRKPPVQVVSPEKLQCTNAGIRYSDSATTATDALSRNFKKNSIPISPNKV